jgi:hypothetical protein
MHYAENKKIKYICCPIRCPQGAYSGYRYSQNEHLIGRINNCGTVEIFEHTYKEKQNE